MHKKAVQRIIRNNRAPKPTASKAKRVPSNSGVFSFYGSIDRQLRAGKFDTGDPGDGGTLVLENKSFAKVELRTKGLTPETRHLPPASNYAPSQRFLVMLATSGTITLVDSSGSAPVSSTINSSQPALDLIVIRTPAGKRWAVSILGLLT